MVIIATTITVIRAGTTVGRIDNKLKQQYNRKMLLLQLLYTGTANQTPGQDLVPVRDNPAYQLANLNRTDHNGSERVTTHEVSPQYENIEGLDKDFKNVHGYENVQQ